MTSVQTSLLLLTALASSLCFNLDTDRPTIFRRDSAGFGHSVVQYADSWVVVGAPQEIKATSEIGGLYKCEYSTSSCEPIPLQVPPEAVNMSLGLFLTAATRPAQLLACGPTVHHACEENMYLNGFCFLLASPSWQARKFPKALQECPKQEQDVAFLIDGSGSIFSRDFLKMLDFVRAVMSQFQKPRTQFSLMQFSYMFRVHFTFSDFMNSNDPQRLLNSVSQLRGSTLTASAIRAAIQNLFVSKSGARRDASKILIVITDGRRKEGDRLEYGDVIPEAEAAGVVRYAVGVGSAFRDKHSQEELRNIASKPYQEHIFRVENFDALRDIQNKLKEKIFAIEGTQTTSSSSFELELSQEGFSAALTPDGPVLGTVGSFSWSGGAFMYPPDRGPVFINMSQENVDMRDSYLGYSMELALWKGVQSLVLGAPRHQHTGKAVIFTQSSGRWTPKAQVMGTQVGSYFGASLCSADVDRDGSSDLVLVGAPHYYEPTRGGQVSVCPLPRGRARWQCEAVLRGEPGHPWGRFGAALTVVGDVNGDRLADVAVGAPGEEENRGAVYLFHGASGPGVSPSHSQRIAGSQLSPGLQHFGQALSGGQDLTMDGLTDLAVGARGHALLLRTRPVLGVRVDIDIQPREIGRSLFECQEHTSSVRELGTARLCLHIYESTKIRQRNLESSVTYDLTLDPSRHNSRATFKETNSRNLTRVGDLPLGQHCEDVKLLLPACVEDSVAPITLRLNFSLVGKPMASLGNLQPILAADVPRYYTASLPFEKNCGADHVCQDDLGINVAVSGLTTLLVGSNLELAMEVKIWNEGEDSYGTAVTFSYPPGLSYRRLEEMESQPPSRSQQLSCDSAADAAGSQEVRSTRCAIKHFIFREGARITFKVTFDVAPAAMLGDRLLLAANVSSQSQSPASSKTAVRVELPVKYAVYTVVSSHEESTKYLNFSASEEKGSSAARHRFQVSNLGQRDLPVRISFLVPVQLNQESVWSDPRVSHAQSPSLQCPSERVAPTKPDFLAHLQKDPVLDCSIAHCLKFRCDVPSFGVQEELDFTLRGNLSFGWLGQTSQKKVTVVTVAEITFDPAVYSQLPGQEAFLRARTETVLEKREVHNPVPLIVGGSVGGLLLLALITATLYKLGFFKRQYKDMMMEQANGQTAAENATPDAPVGQ